MDNNDVDVFVNLVEEKQRKKKFEEVISYDENNFGVGDEYIPEISENSSRSNNGIKKDNILKKIVGKVAMLLAVTTITQSAMCYINGVRNVSKRVYNDIVDGGMVFKKDEDGNVYVAYENNNNDVSYKSDNMGMTAWQDVTIEDYKEARGIAELCNYSPADIFVTFKTLNLEGSEGIFDKNERPSVEDVVRYIEIGATGKEKGRGR